MESSMEQRPEMFSVKQGGEGRFLVEKVGKAMSLAKNEVEAMFLAKPRPQLGREVEKCL